MPSTFVGRHIREILKDDRDLHHRYLTNAQFHYVVDRVVQATTEKQAIRFLLDGLGSLADANDTLLTELQLRIERQP